MKKIFIKWLKSNNCYEQFVFNFNEQKKWHGYSSLDEYLNKYSHYRDYMGIFWWGKAKERFDYWEALHYKWEAFCKNNIKFISKLEKL
jgi:hypothetical protein